MKIRVVLCTVNPWEQFAKVCDFGRFPLIGEALAIGPEKLGNIEELGHEVGGGGEWVATVTAWLDGRSPEEVAALMSRSGFVKINNVHDVGGAT